MIYKKTDKWYIEWQRVVQQVTMDANEWQRMATSSTTNDNKWHNKWQRVVQGVTMSGATSAKKWQRVITSDKEWQRVIRNGENNWTGVVKRMKRNGSK